jgi:hypothetical protein
MLNPPKQRDHQNSQNVARIDQNMVIPKKQPDLSSNSRKKHSRYFLHLTTEGDQKRQTLRGKTCPAE